MSQRMQVNIMIGCVGLLALSPVWLTPVILWTMGLR